MSASTPRVDSALIGAVWRWARQRANRKVSRCEEILPYWLDRQAHEQIRCDLGYTVDEYRRARRWLDAAAERSKGDKERTAIGEILREIGAQHCRYVIQFGQARGEGRTMEEIRAELGLSERDLDLVAEWWRDALAAVRERRIEERG